MNLIKALGSSVSLYADAQALGKTVHDELADPAVKAEIAHVPAIKSITDRISAEWRTVENDAAAVKKSNILTFFGRVSALLSAAKLLEADVAAEQHDPAIGHALLSMPATLGALSKISAEWVKVEADLGGFR